MNLFLCTAEFGKAQIGVFVHRPVHVPHAGEQQQVASTVILNNLAVRGDFQLIRLNFLVFNPAQVLVRQALHDDIYALFVLQTVFEHVQLKGADNADNDLFHAGVRLLENLDGTFLCNLCYSFYKLLIMRLINSSDLLIPSATLHSMTFFPLKRSIRQIGISQ